LPSYTKLASSRTRSFQKLVTKLRTAVLLSDLTPFCLTTRKLVYYASIIICPAPIVWHGTKATVIDCLSRWPRRDSIVWKFRHASQFELDTPAPGNYESQLTVRKHVKFGTL